MGDAIKEELSKVGEDLLEKLAQSFEKRLDLCIKANVGAINIKYRLMWSF
jgi:hypothetical protein